MEEDKKSRKLISSSMVDLKAELFRKQEEFKRQKGKNADFIKAKKSNKDTKASIWSKQNTGVLARAQNDLVAMEKDVEEEELLAKSRRILEQKTKVYDSMITGSSTIPEEDGSEYYLVDFQKKAIDALVEERETKRRIDDQKEEDDVGRKALTDEIPEASCPEDEWVDFKDSLGRDRRCMKKDLSLLMKRDQELALAQAKKGQVVMKTGDDLLPGVGTLNEVSTHKMSDTLPHLMSPDMHRELMRQKWENEAKELLDKGQDEVHYSNVQFDEIRAHGVGYYQFSKDHSKRQEELEKLKKLREETKNQQTSKEKIKDKRKAMMEARLAKVRQRRKLKGEVMEDEKPSEDKDDKKDIDSELTEAVLSARMEEDTKKEEQTKEAEEKRKKHVREWDKEKVESNTWGVKNYVTARREERENEFAPPSLYFDKNTNTSKLGDSHKVLSNTDRLKRLEESISTSSSKKSQALTKDNVQQPAMSSAPFCVDKTSLSASSDSFDSIPLPEGTPSVHCKDHTESGQTLFTGASHSVSRPQPSASISQHQQSHTDTLVSQFCSSEHVNSSWQHWNYTQGNMQPQQHIQNRQEPSESQNWYPMQHSVQYFQQYPIGQTSQGSQLWNSTQSAQHLNNHSASQYTFGPAPSTKSTSNDSSKGTTNMPSSDIASTVPAASSTQSPLAEPPAPKKPKVPKLSVVDMRFMNNFDTSSINPEPGRVPDVEGVPYKPGTFSKYRPLGDGGSSDTRTDVGQRQTGGVAQEGAQISGGPLVYTKEQRERQQQELDEKVDNTSKADSDDEKLQDFLTSIRASSN